MQEQNILRNEFSLDSLLADLPDQEEKKKPIDPNEPRYIVYSQQIDTKTIKRTRNRITPAVCDICGLDLVQLAFRQNKVVSPKFEEIPKNIQTILSEGVKLHKQQVHSSADSLIVSESELYNNSGNGPRRQWLNTDAG